MRRLILHNDFPIHLERNSPNLGTESMCLSSQFLAFSYCIHQNSIKETYLSYMQLNQDITINFNLGKIVFPSGKVIFPKVKVGFLKIYVGFTKGGIKYSFSKSMFPFMKSHFHQGKSRINFKENNMPP